MTHHIWYHSPCTDGLGAAYAAWAALGESGMRYTPVAYNNLLPPIEPEDEVTLLDFSAPREQLLRLAQTAGRITILDHHASAERDLAGLPAEALATEGACEIRVTFDEQHSGAVLAWTRFHPQEFVPLLLWLIEDRDLWRFQWPGSAALHYALAHLSNFRDLNALAISARALDEAVRSGNIILDYLQDQWQGLAGRAAIQHLPLLGNCAVAEAVVCPCPPAWSSDLGHLLLEQHPEAQIAVLYADDLSRGHTTVSMRSRPGGPDVSRIAARLGGGGHTQAAGYRTTLGALYHPWRTVT